MSASIQSSRKTENRTPLNKTDLVVPENVTAHSVLGYEALAKKTLSKDSWNYFASGAGKHTVRESEHAFKRFYLRPHCLHTNRHRDQATAVLGQRITAPICVAPSAFHRLAHPSAESGTAKGATKFGTVMVVSSWANTTIEDIAASAPGATLWMQMWAFKNPQNTLDLVRRAEMLGFRALVVTIDTPLQNSRKSATTAEVIRQTAKKVSVVNIQGAADEVRAAKRAGDHTLTKYMVDQVTSFMKWSDVTWLKRITKLPLVVKGILTAESAKEAVSAGVDGIIVSAHGGRQIEGVLAPIEALPEVVEAVQGTGVEVFVDGGVRTGADVFKCLALGARMVFIGRPALWGLAVEGSEGVYRVLKILSEELDYTMGSCGCNRIDEITRSHVGHRSRMECKL